MENDVKLNQLEEAEVAIRNALAKQGAVEFVCGYSRWSIAFNPNSVTGLVAAGRKLAFFVGTPSQEGQGFTRALTLADTVAWFTSQTITDNLAYLITHIGMKTSTSMPEITQRRILENGVLSGLRGRMTFDFGRGADFPAGNRGVMSLSAATGFGAGRINYPQNGAANMIQLPQDGRIYLPARMKFQFTYEILADYYATTDGLPLGGGNALISTDGGNEDLGYFDLLTYGLKWTSESA